MTHTVEIHEKFSEANLNFIISNVEILNKILLLVFACRFCKHSPNCINFLSLSIHINMKIIICSYSNFCMKKEVLQGMMINDRTMELFSLETKYCF